MDMKKGTAWFPGRFQAPECVHEGHIKQVNKLLEEYEEVVVLVRAIHPTNRSLKNPHVSGRITRELMTRFAKHPRARALKIMAIPDKYGDLDIVHGREVGWDIREVRLDTETEAISGTKLRAEQNE